MRMHRRVTIVLTAFAAVMIGGAALAAVGVVTPSSGAAEGAPAVASPAVHKIEAAATPDLLAANSPQNPARPGKPSEAATSPDPDPGGGITALIPANLGAAIAHIDPRPDWEFTAHQRYEVVDGIPVVNYYWGTSKPGSVVTVESRFGAGRTETNREGKWELRVEFPEAPCNEWFKVVASSGDHQQAFEMKRACRPDVEVDFTAHQKYGECSEDIPYDVFWGTSAPGATVEVDSRLGSGSTTADAEGHWDLRVEFPEAPAGTKFEVSVMSSDGGSAGFGFVYLAEPLPERDAGGDAGVDH